MTITVNGKPLHIEQRCPTTGKVMLEKPEAIDVAERMRDDGLTAVRHYFCKSCSTWHVGNDRRKR